MKSEELSAHGGIWIAEFDVALDAAQQGRVAIF
jgi:hypothetical protein